MNYLVHYGELSLKGKNRVDFEKRLKKNIEEKTGGRVERLRGRFILKNPKNTEILRNLPGIEWFAGMEECRTDEEEVIEKIIEMVNGERPESFRIRVKRVNKEYPKKSNELEEKFGGEVVKKFGWNVKLKKPELSINLEWLKDRVFIFLEKQRGIGGLPVGSSGKVLCMLSGGIDSPVAAFLMMRKGCEVDFVHFHAVEKKELLKSKIPKLLERLNAYQHRGRIYCIPYLKFYEKSMELNPRTELVVFRKFMYLSAEKIVKKEGYLGIVNGDSLGQVASQTLENIMAAESGLEIPVYRPLTGMTKNEIIEWARRIDTYNISIEEYKDCCSLVSAKNPKTKVKKRIIEKEMEKIKGVVEESLEKMWIL